MVNDDNTPKKLPWEDWRKGDDLMTSGCWMWATRRRATGLRRREVQWEGGAGLRGVRTPEGGQSGRRDDEVPGTKPLREVLESHLLDEDIPLAHRGMQGRMWRAQKGAARNKRKMEDMRGRMKELRASRKAAKAEAKDTGPRTRPRTQPDTAEAKDTDKAEEKSLTHVHPPPAPASTRRAPRCPTRSCSAPPPWSS